MTASTAVFPVLGTEGVIRVALDALPPATSERIRDRWAALDEWFSLSRQDSELSLVAAGRRAMHETRPEVRAAYLEAIRWRTLTDGSFPTHRADGTLDLSSLARAYALREAAAELTGSGVESWVAEVGATMVSDALGGAGWTADIPDVREETPALATVPLGGSWTAVATTQRPTRTGQEEFVQASVLGRDVVAVDVLAAAVVAGGSAAFELASDRWPVDVLAVRPSAELRSTPRLARYVRQSADARPPIADSDQNFRSSIGLA